MNSGATSTPRMPSGERGPPTIETRARRGSRRLARQSQRGTTAPGVLLRVRERRRGTPPRSRLEPKRLTERWPPPRRRGPAATRADPEEVERRPMGPAPRASVGRPESSPPACAGTLGRWGLGERARGPTRGDQRRSRSRARRRDGGPRCSTSRARRRAPLWRTPARYPSRRGARSDRAAAWPPRRRRRPVPGARRRREARSTRPDFGRRLHHQKPHGPTDQPRADSLGNGGGDPQRPVRHEDRTPARRKVSGASSNHRRATSSPQGPP